ncbi:MAG: ParA family protein [Clostridia bacterium]|nr:ParA family protein [Clostridia bacterium]
MAVKKAKNTKVICFANNKGGSGKSTTCANVGYALAQMGKRVLLLDGDMQLNLSLSFFPEDEVLAMAQGEKNLYYAIREQKPLTDYIVPTAYEGIDLIPSSTLMSGIEYELFTKWQREMILKKCLQPVRDSGEYDYILLDAPPTLGGWVMNLLCASDGLLLPVEASPWGLFGLANMFEFLGAVKEMNPALELLGIALTKVSVRKNYFKQTLEILGEMEDVYVFSNIIRVDSTIEWAQDSSRPVGAYKASCRSAQEYAALAKEVDARVHR